MRVSERNKPRVLIVEDDPTLNHQITRLLVSRGYSAHPCYEGEGGLMSALSQRFDLILLDVLLPRLDGFEVLNRLRRRRGTYSRLH